MRNVIDHLWKLVLFVVIASTASAGIVVLTPGTVVLEVAFTDVDTATSKGVSNVTAVAYSVDTGLQASASASGSLVKISVEGEQSYRRILHAYGPHGRLTVQRNAAVFVGAATTFEDDYTYDTAQVVANVSVVGGTFNSVTLNLTASQGQESYNGYNNRSLSGTSGQIEGMMVAESAVSVRVTASMYTSFGVHVSRSYMQTVDLSGGGLTVTANFDITDVPPPTVPPPSVLQGVISIPSPFAPLLSHHRVYASSPGAAASQTLYSDGPFSITGLNSGNGSTYARTYFKSPYSYLYRSSQSISLPANGVATHDYIIASMGLAHVPVEVGGFLNNAALDYLSLSISGASGGDAAGYSASDTSNDDSGMLDFALPAGRWNTNSYNLRFQDTNQASYLNASINSSWYNQPSWLLADGADMDLDPIAVTTLQTDLIFDVIEPAGAGAEYDIASPYLYGYAYHYDETGQVQRYTSINDWGSGQKQPVATLRVVGEPGIYQVNARAYVYEPGNPSPTLVNFPSFELVLEGVSTPSCDPTSGQCPVDLVLAGGAVTLSFDQVDVGGLTTATQSPVGPEPPPNFQIYVPDNNNLQPTYYYIQSSASFTGTVEVCMQYDDSGFTAPGQETKLEVGHYDSSAGTWEILTTKSIDIQGNVICALTDSFSPFALLLPSNAEPVADAGDDQSVACLLPGEDVMVTLDGSGSSDPDGDALSYEWSLNSAILATGVAPTVALAAGVHTIALRVSDGVTTSAPDTVTVALWPDIEAPTIDLLGDSPTQVECGMSYVEQGATAYDECSGDVSADVMIDGAVDSSVPGTYQVAYRVSDDAGLTATATRTVHVGDTTAPEVAIADPLVMWPPDHRYRGFALSDCAAVGVDVCDPGLDIDGAGRILSIYSDEPENGHGDGDTEDDIVIDGPSTFRVRMERQGGGNGRVYGITFVVADAAGNASAPETCYVHVPRCQSARCQDVVDDGPAYVVQAP